MGEGHGGWGCPHERGGRCAKVAGRACDPGMKGCVLHGRFRFANSTEKNAGIAVRTRAERHKALKDSPAG
ncbi:MAG: hypothetical protein H7841_02595 [Magnetospirillum sp. WYHS-4]